MTGLDRHPQGDSIFTRVTTGEIATDVGKSRAAACADFNHDGHLDVIVVNAEDNLDAIQDSGNAVIPGSVNHLYTGDGAGGFSRVMSGVVATDIAWSHGAAWAE